MQIEYLNRFDRAYQKLPYQVQLEVENAINYFFDLLQKVLGHKALVLDVSKGHSGKYV